MSDDDQVRAPEGWFETVTANCRPQPAIPAVIVLFLTIVFPVMSYDPGLETRSMLVLLIPVGIVASCGLAVAAGFCSFFPHAAWTLVAAWALKFTESGPLPAYNSWVLKAGMLVCAVMAVVQLWRVRTGRFTPTIRIDQEYQD